VLLTYESENVHRQRNETRHRPRALQWTKCMLFDWKSPRDSQTLDKHSCFPFYDTDPHGQLTTYCSSMLKVLWTHVWVFLPFVLVCSKCYGHMCGFSYLLSWYAQSAVDTWVGFPTFCLNDPKHKLETKFCKCVILSTQTLVFQPEPQKCIGHQNRWFLHPQG